MLVHLWLKFLIYVGYNFPAIKEESSGMPAPTFPPPLNHLSLDLSANTNVDQKTVDTTCKSIPSLIFLTPA